MPARLDGPTVCVAGYAPRLALYRRELRGLRWSIIRHAQIQPFASRQTLAW
jgi:hypothetical protein